MFHDDACFEVLHIPPLVDLKKADLQHDIAFESRVQNQGKAKGIELNVFTTHALPSMPPGQAACSISIHPTCISSLRDAVSLHKCSSSMLL